MTIGQQIASINALSNAVEDRILEGIANKELAPEYVIERCYDDGVIDVYVQPIVPIKSALVTVKVKT
jgi:hypothetical protein